MITLLLTLIHLLLISTFITSKPLSTIVLPNPRNSNDRPSVILKPKKQVIQNFHHESRGNTDKYDKNGSGMHDKRNKRIQLPTRMIENLPKERQPDAVENENEVEPQQKHPYPKGTHLKMQSEEHEYQEQLKGTDNTNYNDKIATFQQPQLVNIPDNKTESNSNLKVLFYDPLYLQDNIPTRIFDEQGNEVDLSGQSVLLIPPKSNFSKQTSSPKGIEQPHSVPSNSKQSIQKDLSKLRRNHPKDNMILFGTILTMAVFVGALTGKRIRKSCNFLKYFIESEGEEDNEEDNEEDRESILMGRDYDTFGRYAGDIRWRGDLEKFDV